MSIRLKDRQKVPPGGFVFFQPETGWESQKMDPPSQWDFKRLARVLQQHRQANPRFNLSTDLDTIYKEIDLANALRVKSIPRAEGYITEDTNPFPVQVPKSSRPHVSKLGVVAAAGGKYLAGAKLFVDWLGDGGKPVADELANQRAAVCVGCPQNKKGDWKSFFTAPAVKAVQRQIEYRNDLKLSTAHDDQLGTCGACLCVLSLKVFTPIAHIAKHMPAEVKAELDPRCWVLKEIQ